MKNRVGSLFSKARSLFSPVDKGRHFDLYERRSFSDKKDSIGYRILFPEHFDPLKKYPLVFVLHGSGERGNDNHAPLTNGGWLFLRTISRELFPAIVVFPQCSKNGFWSNVHITYEQDGKEAYNFQIGGDPTKDMVLLLGVVDDLLSKAYVDKARVYVGGLSMGGMGTFELLRRKPDVFAAAFAICGGDNALNAKAYTKTPLWIFHGENDTVVPVEFSQTTADSIKKFGGRPKLTLYPNVGHNSWVNAFAEPDLLPWLFSKIKRVSGE